MSHPITPNSKPVERQKSPLSNEAYFSSPASTMPGSFPTTPPASSPSQNPNDTPSPNSKSPRRPSVRNLLSFKALRRSYDNVSLGSRPASAGGQSLTASLPPTLNKKRSGTFWRRKSSLGMNFGEDTPSSPTSTVPRDESVAEEQRPMTSAPEEDNPRAQRRKSGTFWRRKSSLNLNTAFAAMNGKENQPQNGGLNGGTTAINSDHANEGQNGMLNGNHEKEEETTMEDAETENSLPEIDEPLPPRTYSPPPQLPEFVGGGGGLGGEDMFKDIH